MLGAGRLDPKKGQCCEPSSIGLSDVAGKRVGHRCDKSVEVQQGLMLYFRCRCREALQQGEEGRLLSESLEGA